MSLQTRAYEARLGVSSGSQYDSNVFRSTHNPDDDFSFSVNPSLTLNEDRSRFSWEVSYRPSYRDYVQFDTRDRWNHRLSGRAGYQIGPRTRIQFSDNFSFTENTANERIFDDSTETTDIKTSKRGTTHNTMSLGLSHELNRRWTGNGGASYTLLDQSGGSNNRSDYVAFGTNASMTYVLTPRNRLGFGGSYSWVRFDDPDPNDLVVSAGTNTSGQIFATWSASLTPNLSIQLRGGPAWVAQNRPKDKFRAFPPAASPQPDPGRPLFASLESCQPLDKKGAYECPVDRNTGELQTTPLVVDDSEIADSSNPRITDADIDNQSELASLDDTLKSSEDLSEVRTTFFAQASLIQRWDKVSFVLSYRRTQNPESSASTTSTVDAINARLNYSSGRNWSLGARAGFTHRTNSNTQIVDRNLVFVNSGLLGRAPGELVATRPVAEFDGEEFDSTRNGVEVNQLSFGANANRRLTRRLTAKISFTGLYQKSRSRDEGSSRDFEQYEAAIGLTYTFEPIQLF